MKQFLKQHAPYRQRYLYQYESETLYGTEKSWASRSSFLSDNIIEAAIIGRAAYAYLASTHTRTLGIDIDDHKNLGEEYLISLYDQTVNKIGLMPSLLVKSPRGLHAYWYIEQFLPTEILVTIAERNMRGIPIEIKPTMTTALRIPNQNTLIDPKTLKKLGKSLEDAIAQAEVYHYAELFEGKLHSDIPASRKQRKDRVVSFKKAEALYQIEAKVVPIGFLDGCTNQQFLELEQAYRCSGLSMEAALDRFALVLARSYGYTKSTKDAINLKSIERRLKCTYRKNDAPIVYKPIEVSLFNQTIIEDLIALSPFAKQREQPLRRFLSKLLAWIDWHDDIMKDKAQIAVFDYYYRYYRKNRKEGYYPLPYSQLKKWNSHYNEIMDWLLKIGFLEASPYQYSKKLSVCKYYKAKWVF